MQTKPLDQFVINAIIIEPISKIIKSLENKEYRDCDVKWLNKKLFHYTEFAAETLGINFNNEQIVDNNSSMNDHCYDRFLQAFKTLIGYFKSI